MVFGTPMPHLCVLCQYLDLTFPITESLLLSVNGAHHAKNDCFVSCLKPHSWIEVLDVNIYGILYLSSPLSHTYI